MTLAALIRKRENVKVATAISAIPATKPGKKADTVATIATVAVANPVEVNTVPITSEQVKVIRAWLAHIEETDSTMIAEVLDKCRDDLEARWYFLKRSEEVPKPVANSNPMTCGDCIHFARIDHNH